MGRAYVKRSSKNSTVGFQAVLMRMVSGDLLLLSDTIKARKHLDPDPLMLEAISFLCCMMESVVA